MDNVVQISHSLNTILSRMERGEGLLGDLTGETPSGQRLRSSLIGTSESLQRIANKVENGRGPLPRLLNDRAMAEQLAQSLDRFESLLDQAQNGPGLLPGLLNDPASRTQFNDTLASLNKVARDLQGFTADLETSDALLPRLVKDEEYGREVAEQVRQFVQRLNEISAKISSGPGTASKLINDPQIYRGRQRHHHRRQRVPGAALADPEPAEEGHRQAVRGHEEGDRGAGRKGGAARQGTGRGTASAGAGARAGAPAARHGGELPSTARRSGRTDATAARRGGRL